MFYTYALFCLDKNLKTKLYIGSTDNLKARVKDHQTKSVKSTKRFDKITLIYYEACLNKKDARKRELQLKTGFGRGYIKRRLANHLAGLVKRPNATFPR